MIKQCDICKVDKALWLFYKNSTYADGYTNSCIDCIKVKRKSKEYPVVKLDKKCKDCNKVKPYSEFNRNKRVKDGLKSECSECSTARQKYNKSLKREVEVNIPETKTCPKCQVSKGREGFSLSKTSKDGLQHHCMECKNEYNNSLSYVPVLENKVCTSCNIDKPKSHFRTSKRSPTGLQPECKECNYLRDKSYREDNWSDIYIKKKKYADDNREYLNRQRVERYHSDLDKYRSKSNFYAHARRVSQPEWAMEYKQDWEALYALRLKLEAGGETKYHVDHIIPVVHPEVCGLSVPWNYQLLTQEDNIRKSNKFDGTYDNDSWRSGT